jgi:hypothetical protein
MDERGSVVLDDGSFCLSSHKGSCEKMHGVGEHCVRCWQFLRVEESDEDSWGMVHGVWGTMHSESHARANIARLVRARYRVQRSMLYIWPLLLLAAS